MTEENILISPIYKRKNIMRAVSQVRVDKLILIADEKDKSEDVEDAIKKVKESLKDVVDVQVERSNPYDMPDIAEKVGKIIREEHPNRISINITPGRKTQSFAVAFAGYSNQDKIEEIFYLKEEGGKLLIPLLEFSMPENQRKVLKVVSQGFSTVDEVVSNVDISKAMVYNHIRDLKENGYLREDEDGLEITESGELMTAMVE